MTNMSAEKIFYLPFHDHCTVGTGAMGKGRFGMPVNVCFKLVPITLIISDFLAGCADGQQPFQHLDLGHGLLQTGHMFLKLLMAHGQFLFHSLIVHHHDQQT